MRPLLDFGQRLRASAVWCYRHAPFDERVEQLRLRLEWKLLPIGGGDRVPEESEWPRRGYRGIEHPQATGSGIARICKHWITGPRARLVHLLESVEREVDFAANLDAARGRALVKPKGNVPHRSEIDGDVLPDGSVAARCAHDEDPILVCESDRRSVDLELRRVA
jgi:hypothetical protein